MTTSVSQAEAFYLHINADDAVADPGQQFGPAG